MIGFLVTVASSEGCMSRKSMQKLCNPGPVLLEQMSDDSDTTCSFEK